MGLKIPETISEKQLIETIKRIKKPKTRLAFLLGFYQCMRVSEVIKLKPEDIDYDRGFIYIRQSKGKKDRQIPIVDKIRRFLKHLPISVSRQAIHQQVKKYLPDHHFHTLRHSGATYYLNEKKIGIRQLQQFLGHSRIDTTQIYTHVTPDNLREVFKDV